MIVRILLWNVLDSKTTVAELRGTLSPLDPPGAWISNDATERFGAIVFGDELPDAVAEARALIGRDADVYEEFDS